MSAFSVFLIDPHRLVREGIKVLLQGTCIQIVGESADPKEALEQIAGGMRADLILAEWPKRKEDADMFLQGVHRAAPGAKLVFLTNEFDSDILASVSEHGVCGLLQKDISTTALLHALKLVMLGEHVFPIALKFLLSVQRPSGDDGAPAVSGDVGELSAREVEILRCLTNGLANKVIARKLEVAETTVKAHIKTILRKIHVDNRTQAAIWCLSRGLDHPGDAVRLYEANAEEAGPWRVQSEHGAQGGRYNRKAST